MNGKLNIDKLDLQIIQAMMEDAEISYADLGKKLFVSGGTIHVRIKKLEELKVVKGRKLAVDLKTLGYDVIAFIGIYFGNAIYEKYNNLRLWQFENILMLAIGIPFLFLQTNF